MTVQRKTIRRKPPITRKYLKTLNELERTVKRLKLLSQHIEDIEIDSRALHRQNNHDKNIKLGIMTDNGRLGPEESVDIFLE